MPQKKVPTRSKIIVAIVAFFVTLYAVFVGISYLKSWNDFKPYHKLAVELNEGLGGGYTITEVKNCGIDTPNCPSSDINMKNLTLTINSAKASKDKIENLIKSKGFTTTENQSCRETEGDISFCGLTLRNNEQKLEATVGIGNQFIAINIHRP